MAIQLTESSGWIGLLGLIVPFVIHLLSKKEKRTISFGSLRFLQPIESESARSLQLSQYLLLLSRLMLLGLICLLLFGPYSENEKKSKQVWIEKKIYESPSYQNLWTNLQQEIEDKKVELHLYSHQLSDSSGVSYFVSTWTLIDYLNSLSDSSTVYSHSLQKNFVGRPVEMQNFIDWKVVPQQNFVGQIYQLSKNQETIEWNILSDQDKVLVNTKTKENYNRIVSPTFNIRLNGDEYKSEVDQIKKVISLSQDYLYYDINWLVDSDDTKEDMTIVVGEKPSNLYEYYIHWRPTEDQLSIRSSNHSLSMVGKITRESIIDTNLPLMVSSYFNKRFTSIMDQDRRIYTPMPVTDTKNKEHTNAHIQIASIQHSRKSIDLYILLLIVLVFIGERYLQFKNGSKV